MKILTKRLPKLLGSIIDILFLNLKNQKAMFSTTSLDTLFQSPTHITKWPWPDSGNLGHNHAIYKEDDKYVAELEVPGFLRSNFSIEWEGDKLYIKGDRHKDAPKPREYITNNRSSDSVEFKITDFEGEVDRQKTHASYEAGVLYIVMPMKKDRKQKVEVW